MAGADGASNNALRANAILQYQPPGIPPVGWLARPCWLAGQYSLGSPMTDRPVAATAELNRKLNFIENRGGGER
jgi:hypothetical protein